MSQKSETVPDTMREFYDPIVRVIDEVCEKHLNDEYKTLAHQLTAALARKRPSPLTRGKPQVWACGVLYALGTVNFLWDKSQTPHMRADELCKACGVSSATGSAQGKKIRDLFKMRQLDPEWCLPSRVDSNPLVWMFMVNGLPMDIRDAPLGAQLEAYSQGLIPYIPALGREQTQELDAQLAALEAQTMAEPKAKRGKHAAARAKSRATEKSGQRCGICGSTTKPLTRTNCCGNWICDDEDDYVMFSYAHNSCHRNHDRYTLCSYHYNEGHSGKWQDCEKCRAGFETEIYVYYGTNEYNFEKLENPPAFEPTHCAQCGTVINLGYDGYLQSGPKYYCESCGNKRIRDVIRND